MISTHRRVAISAALVLQVAAVLFSASAPAQQRVPGPMEGINKEIIPFGALGQRVMQVTPSSTPPLATGIGPAEGCAFSEVEPKELDSVRTAILDLLAADPVARQNFVTSEKQIPSNCPRRKASFYLRAIARVKAAK